MREPRTEMTLLDRVFGGAFMASVVFGLIWVIQFFDGLFWWEGELSPLEIGMIAGAVGCAFALLGIRVWDWVWRVTGFYFQ